MPRRELTLIKVGGSLYDLPDLASRLRTLIARHDGCILFPGGGPAADVVRHLDAVHHLGEEAAHWLALRALTMNAYFLHSLLPELTVAYWPDVPDNAILDPHAFALADESNADHLPHTWEATSDALAARAARVLGARQLILLKSVALPEGCTWYHAARAGHVDALFPALVELMPEVNVRWLRFR